MAFENIEIADPDLRNGLSAEVKLTTASDEDVDFLEMMAETTFPDGYRKYITTLGRGEYCQLIRIDMPQDILLGYKKYRRFLNQHWFWESGEAILPKQKALECIKIGDTTDGHVMIFHPSNSAELFALPHEDEMIYRIGSNLYEAIDWFCMYNRPLFTNSLQKNNGREFFTPYS